MNTITAARLHPPEKASPQAGACTQRTQSLGRYRVPATGHEREVLRIQRPTGDALVVDYQFGTLSDGRLIAQLSPDEPAENALIVCELYLADGKRRGRCRAVTPEDFHTSSHIIPSPSSDSHGHSRISRLQDATGHVYRISEVRMSGHAPELRWTRSRHPDRNRGFDTVTLRDVIGSLEAYEPARTLTRDALARCGEGICTRRLREEAQRLAASPIVLNRGLREAVQRALQGGEMTRSDVAVRCGRLRSDPSGSSTGEASWIARRIGEMPEGGEQNPCPWIHSDVLALIARDGLGISPHEVEL